MRYPIVCYLTKLPRSSQNNAGKSHGKNPGQFFLLFFDPFSIHLSNEFYIHDFLSFFFLIFIFVLLRGSHSL